VANLLEDGARWLGRRLQESAGIAGTYARGGTESNPIVGVAAQHEYEVVDDESGLPTKVIAYDWTFTADELVIAGDPVTPRKGDRWKTTTNGANEVFEVVPIGKRPCFERADTSGVLLVVHTKKVSG
jgi:hypothetical protein